MESKKLLLPFLFLLNKNKKSIKDIHDVKNEIKKIINRQRPGSNFDISAFKDSVEELLDLIVEFRAEWHRLPVVFRVARIRREDSNNQISTARRPVINSEDNSKNLPVIAYQDSITLPDTKHDLDLVIMMLNYMREQKGLKKANMPLFIQPDEIFLAYKEGRIAFPTGEILTQMSIVFQKGTILNVGFVFGRDYVVLANE